MRCSVLSVLLLAGAATAQAADRLPLVVDGQAIRVEVAATPQARERGLMGRTHLAADSGMLFVFETRGRYCFWMRDTLLPLSIAFIDDSGRVVGRADMQPRTETPHCPPADVRYALEVAQGSFLRQRLAPGAQVRGLPR